ncbi:MAG: CRISPR-associated endonuclease Cas2 [Acidobacteria bacterium]|nr:CRISPR-associated endonuclease Cas2 [Acidobacteriota bacterium]
MLYLIAYDVVDDNRRTRLFEALKDFGRPVQRSVFECDLEDGGLDELLERIDFEVDRAADSCRIYKLCKACAADAIEIGRPTRPDEPQVWII